MLEASTLFLCVIRTITIIHIHTYITENPPSRTAMTYQYHCLPKNILLLVSVETFVLTELVQCLRLYARQLRNWSFISGRMRFFCSTQWAPPNNLFSVVWGKVAGDWSWPLNISLVKRLRMLCLHFPISFHDVVLN
jgi:hypothetical protein